MNTSTFWRWVSRSPIIRKIFQVLFIVGLSFFIGLADYLTGPDYTFSPFYLIPPSLAAWKMSRGLALFASILNSILWLWVDFSSGRFSLQVPIYGWNFSSRLISLLIVAVLFSSLRKVMDHEKQMSSIDHLTKALNSRTFKEVLDLEIKRALRYQHYLTLVYLDIDNFKLVNDLFGHAIGDNVLATIVDLLRNSIRQNDVIGRLGGDEFGILLVETDPDSAQTAVTKLQNNLMAIIQENNWPITLSFGVLSCTNLYCPAEKMISLADQLMYSVKKTTKNNANFAVYSDIGMEIA